MERQFQLATDDELMESSVLEEPIATEPTDRELDDLATDDRPQSDRAGAIPDPQTDEDETDSISSEDRDLLDERDSESTEISSRTPDPAIAEETNLIAAEQQREINRDRIIEATDGEVEPSQPLEEAADANNSDTLDLAVQIEPPTDESPSRSQPSRDRFDLSNLVEGQDYNRQEVIVGFAPGVRASDVNALQQQLNARVLETTQTLDAQLWQIEGMSVAQAIETFSGDRRIKYIEPNYRVSVDTTLSDDPSLNQLWGLNNTGQTGGTPDADIDAPEAWDLETGEDVIVGVIDSGVDYTHPDLAANMWINPGEIADDGIDNDNNGYVDDVHGYDFANDDGDPFDDDGHGTHVAGTIAAVGNNDLGVTGVSWSANIMGLKFLDAEGFGSTFDAVQAIEYAIMMGAKLTNNSWGGGGYSQALYDAIEKAGNSGQLFVAAAGNSSSDNDSVVDYPSGYDLDNIISVAATTDRDELAVFSSFGATSVDLGAPGSSIYSTIPGGKYANNSGTSMATPHVSGVASLLWSQEPELTAQEVKDRILDYTDPIAALEGKTVTGGRLNAFRSLSQTLPLPGEIQGSKWHDLNEDGDRDSDEPGLEGWTIFLDPNQNGKLDSGEISTETDSNGDYSFTDLTPGTYTVAEVLQEGWKQTYPGINGGFETGSLASWSSTGFANIKTSAFGSGPTEGTYQALLTNGSGGVSDANLETFLGLDAGSLDGLGNGNAVEGGSLKQTVTVSAGATLSFDWNFLTNEGTPGNPFNDFAFVAIASETVDTLSDTNGSFVTSPTAFNNETQFGTFEYTFSQAGTYQIGVGVVDVADPTVDSGLLVDNFSLVGGSLAQPGNHTVYVGEDETVSDLNFGNIQSQGGGEIHGSKWHDFDGDGQWDDDEPGLEGWTIYLDQNDNGELDADELFTVTDEDGNYSFTDLDADTYIVAEVQQEGWEQTYPGTIGTLEDSVEVFKADFTDENGNAFLDGFAIENTGAKEEGLWHLSTGRGNQVGHSAEDSLYFGQNEGAEGGGNYDVGDTAGRITSTSIDLTGFSSAELSFNYYLGVESDPDYDQVKVLISQDGGTFTEIASKNDGLLNATSAWTNTTIDLTSYVGSNIQIQFDFDTIDDFNNFFEGWYVDDVVVSGSTEDTPSVPGIHTVVLEPEEVITDIDFGNRSTNKNLPPQLSIDNVSLEEGDSGTSEWVFTVSLSQASTETVTVEYETESDTATAGEDYESTSGQLTFNPGEMKKTIAVSVNGDLLEEPDEAFFVNLSNATNATIADSQGQGTILNDDTEDSSPSHDAIVGTSGHDSLDGGAGHDTIEGLEGHDAIDGGPDHDLLYGGAGHDTLDGGSGYDEIYGNSGQDFAIGGTGNDQLNGGPGNDILVGVDPSQSNPGQGEIDLMTGGAGFDRFVLGDEGGAYYTDGNVNAGGAIDFAVLTDFDLSEDFIQLSGSSSDYVLSAVGSHTDVYLDDDGTPGFSAQDERIARIQGVTGLALSDPYFIYV